MQKYLAVCFLFSPLVVFFSLAKPWGLETDFWDTAAAVRELSVRPFHPSHPLLSLPAQFSPRFNPYTLFWGLIKQATRLDIFTTMGLAGITNFVIFMTGLFLFVSDKFKNRSLPVYAFLTMLWVWGSGYGHSNAYHLEMLLITLPYASFFAFGLSLNALYFLNRYITGSRWHDLLFYAATSALAFVSHPVTGCFCYLAALAVLLENGNWKTLISLQGVPLLALGGALLWPYFSYWDLFTKNSVITTLRSPLFSRQIQALGPALIGVPIVIFYASRKRYSFILIGLVLCSLFYGFSFLGNIQIGARFILFAVFFLHLGIALYLAEAKVSRLSELQKSFHADGALLFLLFVLLVIPVPFRVGGMAGLLFPDGHIRLHGYASPVKPYLFLSRHLTGGDVVLASDWQEGFLLPAITGCRIIEPRNSFTLLIKEESLQRKKDVAAFFQGPLTLEERIEFLRRYRATHILVDLKDEPSWHVSFKESLGVIGTEIARDGAVILYRTRLLAD